MEPCVRSCTDVSGVEGVGGELEGVHAQVVWPGIGEAREALVVAGEEGARGLLELRLIPERGRHETIGGFERAAPAVGGGARGPGLLDESPEGRRGAPGLRGEPLPVARQERDLARDDAEPRAAGAAAMGLILLGALWCAGRSGGRVREAREHVVETPAEVEFEGLARLRVEHQEFPLEAVIDRAFGAPRDLVDVTGGDEPWSGEGDEASAERAL